MELVLIAFVWVLNLAISFWNSYAVGVSWPYTKQMGGFAHLVNWCGFIMAGCGFSWCFLLPLALFSYYYHFFGFDQAELSVTMMLGYLVLAPMIILSGLGIWIDSLVQAWKTRSFTNIAVAAYNTYAQISNMIDFAGNVVPFSSKIFDYVKEALSSSDDEDDNLIVKLIYVCLLVAISICSGFMFATAISRKFMKDELAKLKVQASIHKAASSISESE